MPVRFRSPVPLRSGQKAAQCCLWQEPSEKKPLETTALKERSTNGGERSENRLTLESRSTRKPLQAGNTPAAHTESSAPRASREGQFTKPCRQALQEHLESLKSKSGESCDRGYDLGPRDLVPAVRIARSLTTEHHSKHTWITRPRVGWTSEPGLPALIFQQRWSRRGRSAGARYNYSKSLILAQNER